MPIPLSVTTSLTYGPRGRSAGHPFRFARTETDETRIAMAPPLLAAFVEELPEIVLLVMVVFGAVRSIAAAPVPLPTLPEIVEFVIFNAGAVVEVLEIAPPEPEPFAVLPEMVVLSIVTVTLVPWKRKPPPPARGKSLKSW